MSTCFAQCRFSLVALALAATLVLLSSAAAQTAPGRPGGFGPQRGSDELVKLRVATDTAAIKPGGTFHLVFIFDIEPDWHLYWKNPAAGAAPITINVTAPHGFVVEDVRWPRPTAFESPVGAMFGYAKQVALYVPIRAPMESVPDAAALRYDVGWAVCDDQRCVMGQRQDMHTISRGVDSGGASESELQRIIRRHRTRLPMNANDTSDIEVRFEGETLTVTGPAQGHRTAELFPNPTPGVSFGEPEFAFEDGRFTLTVAVETNPRNFMGTKPAARALIGLGDDEDDPSIEFEYALE